MIRLFSRNSELTDDTRGRDEGRCESTTPAAPNEDGPQLRAFITLK